MSADAVDGGRGRPENPFPGLRPFEPHESSLFFGRDEQCDDLLTRLARRRLVAVVGMSGSGKSSLVRAGLLPALDRGYIPSAGSSWHVAVFRPGSQPLDNLTRALASRRRPGDTVAEESPDEIRALLDSSSLGLAAAARLLLTERGDSLLVVADQFEEIFRFGRIVREREARDRAAACVDLLINASQQDQVPVYVVLTMRSDYLGDCAHFTGLPEALNDSQFLVPRMTRAQLRAAIECPIAVCGGRISPRLVQRLLHDVDRMSSPGDEARQALDQQDQDQLPVLQHALMRVWEVSRAARERGDAIDLPHYEQPPVETLRHALDRHAEEVFNALPTDRHREVARLVFQRLTDRDAENREVRRPTPLRELAGVALRRSTAGMAAVQATIVSDVIAAFSAEGRAFVVVNAQQDVDISHESFIRKWERLRQWVEEEHRSGRIYAKLADAASRWARGEASLYRGPELAEARRWWQQETPNEPWADRYGSGFAVAQRFLTRSVSRRRLGLGLVFGNAALLVVAAVAIAGLMVVSRNEAMRAEAAALEARNAAEASRTDREEAVQLRASALQAQSRGDSVEAEALRQRAQLAELQANNRQVLTPTELSELDRLRKQEGAWKGTETALRQQLATQKAAADSTAAAPAVTPALTRSDKADLDRLRKAEAAWDQEKTQLQQQLAALNDRVTKSEQADAALKKTNEELYARLAASAGTDESRILRLLDEFRAAYEKLDVAAIIRLWPSAPKADLTRSFSQYRSYQLAISDVKIAVAAAGDTAVVTGVRRVSVVPKVGTAQSSAVPTTFQMKRSGGSWILEDVQGQP